MTAQARIAGLATATAVGIALAGGATQGLKCATQDLTTLATAEASPTVQTQDPPCGFDVYKGKVYVTSLGKAHGTARVSLQSKRYSYISTNVGTKRIKQGQSITIKPNRRVKANRVTVDIVKGKLTRNESRRKVWHCEPA